MEMLKTVNIVTTGALPWRTGTAILALLRAHYLSQRGLDVVLYIPWISPSDQSKLFGENSVFETQKSQERHIRTHLPGHRTSSLEIEFYPGKYVAPLGSIFPKCRISKRLHYCDWLILEEPEHLNWLHPFSNYRNIARRVTGIVLTNYRYYCEHAIPWLPFLGRVLGQYNKWLITRHCDDIIRPSNAIPEYNNSMGFHANGVHPSFLESNGEPKKSKGIYFIGKLIWEKGFRELIDLLSKSNFSEIDIYGEGRDREAIERYGHKRGVHLHFKGNSTNPATDLRNYKMFINPSRSEVICTTTGEALGQQRFVILPGSPSNEGYYKFKNCLVYNSEEEFQEKLSYALTNLPQRDPELESLSWEAATDRLFHYHRETNKKYA